MRKYTLSRQPNQEFSTIVDGHLFEFRLHAMTESMIVDVTIDGESVIHSLVCAPSGWLVPFGHQHIGFGNFRFECSDENYPYYENFGKTCFLYYYSADELVTLDEGGY